MSKELITKKETSSEDVPKTIKSGKKGEIVERKNGKVLTEDGKELLD